MQGCLNEVVLWKRGLQMDRLRSAVKRLGIGIWWGEKVKNIGSFLVLKDISTEKIGTH